MENIKKIDTFRLISKIYIQNNDSEYKLDGGVVLEKIKISIKKIKMKIKKIKIKIIKMKIKKIQIKKIYAKIQRIKIKINNDEDQIDKEHKDQEYKA